MTLAEAIPRAALDAPLLRGLDERARREIAEAGRVLDLPPGGIVYRAGEAGTSFFVVASGAISLHAVRRGEDREAPLRSVGPGESFGEEATVNAARRATARAEGASTVVEVPVHLFRRAAGRAGKAGVAERIERTLRRQASRDLLGTSALGLALTPREIDALLDAAEPRSVERGEPLYRQGDPAREVLVIADGRVQVQVEEEGRLHVRAYLGRGDFLGDVEVLAEAGRGERAESAVASGPVELLALPAAAVLALAEARPGLFPSLRRLARDEQEGQRAIVGRAARNATQHAFRDLYRLEVARSLLVIDLESCVRCGHCAWACAEVHGVARLVRRGDKIVTRLDAAPSAEPGLHGAASDAPQHLMLPSSCQHCENPACMADCPTGAIGREPGGGEVTIAEARCTGCGACAKACPWDNIQMAPRPPGAPAPAGATYPDLAVKCDLCHGLEGPACVRSCPTGAILRVNPAEELGEVRDLLGGGAGKASRRTRRKSPMLTLGAALAALGLGVAGSILGARGQLRPGAGPGLFFGVLAALGMVALLAYAIPKRLVRRLAQPKAKGSLARASEPVTSRVEPMLALHVALGLVTAGCALAHSPWPPGARGGSGGALEVALLATSILGAFTAAAYRLVPKRLTRLERAAALPEDFARARKELLDRLFREASGRSELVKKLLDRVLLPYARAPLGSLSLLASGKSLREEERALGARIDALLEGRGKERLAGLAALVRVVVELRALSAQRVLLGVLRAGLVPHIVTFGVAVALLVAHVALVFRRIG